MADQKKVMEKVAKNRLQESQEWKDSFTTPDGMKCLKLLQKKFYDIDRIAVANHDETLARAARRDLVAFIFTQIEENGD